MVRKGANCSHYHNNVVDVSTVIIWSAFITPFVCRQGRLDKVGLKRAFHTCVVINVNVVYIIVLVIICLKYLNCQLTFLDDASVNFGHVIVMKDGNGTELNVHIIILLYINYT